MKLYLSQSYEAPAHLVQGFRNEIAKYNHVNVTSYNTNWSEHTHKNIILDNDAVFAILPSSFYNSSGQLKHNGNFEIQGIIGRGIFNEIGIHNNVYIISCNKNGNICCTNYDPIIDDMDMISGNDYKKWAKLKIYGADNWSSLEDIVGPVSNSFNPNSNTSFNVTNSSYTEPISSYGSSGKVINFRRIAAFSLRKL